MSEFMKSRLLRLSVKGVLSAERAVLLELHALRMSLLVLGCVVIAVLALSACQCNLCTHNSIPPCGISVSIRKRPRGL